MVFNRLNRVDNNADNGKVATIGIRFCVGWSAKNDELTGPAPVD